METVSKIGEVASGQKVLSIGPSETVTAAAAMMAKHQVGCLVVADEKTAILGILCERDIVAKVVGKSMDPKKVTVGSIMTRKVVACTMDTPIPRAQRVMAEQGIRHIPVVEDGVPVAMISSRDILAHQLATVRSIARKQSKILNELEGVHPGISRLVTDDSGRIVI